LSRGAGSIENESALLRILDANCNRLREALRVVEEYFRFVETCPERAARCKALRHAVHDMETGIGTGGLLKNRDTATDPLASVTRPEERSRAGAESVLAANFKRGQEAARAVEEYAKAAGNGPVSETAKRIRFELYDFEKTVSESARNG
jgi:thiamine-phosphate pyrophosphorylase